MAMIQPKSPIGMYTRGEELLNSISHGVGTLFAIGGTAYLVTYCVLFCDVWSIVSAAIYGGTLILLYAMSTLYHAITNEKAKRIMRILDHSTIFLLISGTYTPYALVTLNHGPMGWTVFGIVWGCAVLGITLNAISIERFKKFSMALYILSGWAAIIAMKPIVEHLAPGGLILMLLGGVFYTGGIAFYVMKRKKYFHGIWHFFVLAGSVAHYFSVLFYVVR